MNRGGVLVWEIGNGAREAWREEERAEQEGVGEAMDGGEPRWRELAAAISLTIWREEGDELSLDLEWMDGWIGKKRRREGVDAKWPRGQS